jgi:phage tail-like protein
MTRLIPEIEGYKRLPLEVVDGVGGIVQVMAFRDGADVRVRMHPGPATWDSIVVRRTASGSPALWKWWKATVDGTVSRRNVLVQQVDERGTAIAKWALSNCWPTRWRLVPVLDKSGKNIHVEEMTLAVEAMDLA